MTKRVDAWNEIVVQAPGKIILFGEHAVVYGQPAIAAPVTHVQTTATVAARPAGHGLLLDLPDVQQRVPVLTANPGQPLAHVARLAWQAFGVQPDPDLTLTVRSTIPVASGLGSGAAAATAIVRALAAVAGVKVTPAEVSALVYRSEQLFHGSPSGVDNTVIAYNMPVWFVRGHAPEPFAIARPFTLVIGDTGVASPTAATVGDVRRQWQAEPARLEVLFAAVGDVARAARAAIAAGDVAALGPLLDANQRLLQAMQVSSPELDALCTAARQAGALGAKLSGGGRGGNMLALVADEQRTAVLDALRAAGAVRAFATLVGGASHSPQAGV